MKIQPNKWFGNTQFSRGDKMKKRWVLVSVVAAVIAIGVGAGGVALAQENSTGKPPCVSNFASRLATSLGLDSALVQTAIDEAKRKQLDSLVEQGRLTRAQADAYLE